MADRKKLVVVAGPTGSGKTDLGIALARRYGVPVLSADSRQVFRGLAIGTAQPTAGQLALAEHHMIANHEVTEPYTCGHYEREALEILETLFQKHDLVIAVGGSGLYIDALCYGMDKLPEADPALREKLGRQWKDDPGALLTRLQELDPAYYAQVDRNNSQRVIRAVEVCLASGKPYSEQRQGVKRQRDFDILKIGLTMPRNELYGRINHRVDAMLEAGLEEEAHRFYPRRELNALQTVGYREFFFYFDGDISREEVIDLIKRNSRRYAKRQMTWFMRDNSIQWFTPSQQQEVMVYVDRFLEEEFAE